MIRVKTRQGKDEYAMFDDWWFSLYEGDKLHRADGTLAFGAVMPDEARHGYTTAGAGDDGLPSILSLPDTDLRPLALAAGAEIVRQSVARFNPPLCISTSRTGFAAQCDRALAAYWAVTLELLRHRRLWGGYSCRAAASRSLAVAISLAAEYLVAVVEREDEGLHREVIAAHLAQVLETVAEEISIRLQKPVGGFQAAVLLDHAEEHVGA